MAVKEMNDIKLIQTLKGFNKSYFTIFDLGKILDVKKDSLYVTLNRLVKSGVLIRLKRGIYQPEFKEPELEKTAGELYYPSYLSFESALSRFGVLNLIPYSLSFATTRKTKSMSLLERQVVYRHLKQKLFFGFTHEEGLYIAEPEKALLDLVYLRSLGKAEIPSEEMDLRSLSEKTLREYAGQFPSRVMEVLEQLLS